MKDTLSGPDLDQGRRALERRRRRHAARARARRTGAARAARRRRCSRSAPSARITARPLADGLLVDDTVRCPWHHACFSLRTGEALRAPALDPVSCWRVEQRDGNAYVREKLERAGPHRLRAQAGMPKSVVIVGGGAAGNAAAETLRREGYAGRITMLSADASVPCDRPNLSKGYLAGTAPEESNPLRSPEFYEEHGIDLKLGARVAAIDTASRHVQLVDGSRHAYDALLLATGAEPVRLDVPGGDSPARALSAHARRQPRPGRQGAGCRQRAVVIGASFIGLEVAASLRARNIEVHVVAPETVPWRKSWERRSGTSSASSTSEHGVTFHLGTTATSIDERSVTLAERRRPAGRSRRRRHRRAAGDRAGGTGGPRHRSRRHGERVPRDERSGHLRGRRHRALAGPAHRRAHPRRTLGGGRAPGADRGAQHARAAGAVRRRAVLLDRAVRFRPRVCRSRRALGQGRDRRAARRDTRRLHDHLSRAAARSWPWPSCTAISRACARKSSSRAIATQRQSQS